MNSKFFFKWPSSLTKEKTPCFKRPRWLSQMSEIYKIATRLRDVDVKQSTLNEFKKSIRQENIQLVEK